MPEPDKLQQEAERLIGSAKDLAALEVLEVSYLGRKGHIASLFTKMAALPIEERKVFGQTLNAIKTAIEESVAKQRSVLQGVTTAALHETEWIDVTQPGVRPPEGHLHLTTHAIREIADIFQRIGFYRVRYPEVDWDWYAFESLNMPGDHPARDEWETFFIDQPEDAKRGKLVLIPHTSNGQVREMESGRMPMRMINIARCYRRQSDISHAPMFHQFEGVYIDEGVSLTHLKGVFDYFVHGFFGKDRKTRLRPHHFRFTEPSVELDISCDLCSGTGFVKKAPSPKLQASSSQRCRMCKSGWLELGGAGMINHNVLRAGNIDPTKYSGFAFGWGVERTAMMRSGLKIDDIRILYKNDLRFLKQF
jgi:phenylalanyl-tRNA synthetase alpha chain